jgi:hypothetical protein
MSFSIYYPIFRLKHDYDDVFIDRKFIGNALKPHPLIVRVDAGVSVLLEFSLSIKTILLNQRETRKWNQERENVRVDSGKPLYKPRIYRLTQVRDLLSVVYKHQAK